MSDRPTRQDLVVPRKRSNLPFVLGAAASGCAGFVAVLALGLGRSGARQADDPSLEPPIAAAFAPENSAEQEAEPGRFAPSAGSAPRPTANGPGATDRYGDRYPIQTTSLDTPGDVVPTAASSSRFSRFANGEEPALESAPPADENPSAEPGRSAETIAPESDIQTIGEPAASTESEPANDLAEEPAAAPTNPFLTQPISPAAVAAAETEAAADSRPLPEDVGDLVAQPETAAANAASVPAAAAPATAFSRDIDPPASFPRPNSAADPEAPMPHASTDLLATTVPAAAVTGNPLRGNGPAAPARPQLAAAVPFAAAPPLVPGLGAASLSGAGGNPPLPGSGADTAPAGGGSTGQGRPGPMQLEGVQTPQLSVEKRGPREVQVGKAARYEILVRNVGSATAHECLLRDSVPYGTTLVATTPPASPTNPATGSGGNGDLVWMLGTLPPGGQARVAMELMPTTEGDVGSVASVTFRADASVRSRATKPALRLEMSDPKPILIGKDVNVSIKITNPGTGVATGVVLEGALPEQLIHKSGRELEFDVGQLQPGGSRTIDLALGSTGPGVHTVRLVARADGQIEVEHQLRIEVTAPTLEIAVVMPTRRYLQRPATCVISMANTGTAPAKAVELAAQLPPGVKFVRANNAGYYDERGHRVLWNLEELPAAETGSCEVVVMPIDLGPQKIVAAARSADGLSDQVAHTLEVEGLAAISFEVTDSEDPIEVGGLTEYIVRVRNQGTKSASGVRLTATMLGELEPIEAKGPAAHRIENLSVGFEPLAKLAPAEEAIFRVRVRGHREGDQRVQVQLTSDDHAAPITKEEITRVYSDR